MVGATLRARNTIGPAFALKILLALALGRKLFFELEKIHA